MLAYNIETLGTFLPDCKDLLIKNWQELGSFTLHPDLDKYVALEKNGNLLIVTVRDNGMLVGYTIMFLLHPIHYMEEDSASNDVIYLDPAYRKGRVGIKLIEFTEKQLVVRVVTWHVKRAHPVLGTILEYRGYDPLAISYR